MVTDLNITGTFSVILLENFNTVIPWGKKQQKPAFVIVFVLKNIIWYFIISRLAGKVGSNLWPCVCLILRQSIN